MTLRQWFIQRLAKRPAASVPEGGRSSKETGFTGGLTGLLNHYDGINPLVPVEMYRVLTLLSIVNPDVAQAVKSWQNIGNTGHTLVVADAKGKAIDRGLQRLNEQAFRLYQISAGVDGLINHYLNQLAISGAISSEDVVTARLDGVDKVVIVPVYGIKFQLQNGGYAPYQKLNDIGSANLIELNPLTYSYFAAQTAENSPYAIPPMVSALGPITTQREMVKNLNYMVRKFGLLGLTEIEVPSLLRLTNESDETYTQRNQSHINNVAEAVKNNYSEGLLVFPAGMAVKHNNLTNDARGVRDLFQLNEEQLFSGLNIDPAIACST